MILERVRQMVCQLQQLAGQLEAQVLAAEMNQELSIVETEALVVLEQCLQRLEALEKRSAK